MTAVGANANESIGQAAPRPRWGRAPRKPCMPRRPARLNPRRAKDTQHARIEGRRDAEAQSRGLSGPSARHLDRPHSSGQRSNDRHARRGTAMFGAKRPKHSSLRLCVSASRKCWNTNAPCEMRCAARGAAARDAPERAVRMAAECRRPTTILDAHQISNTRKWQMRRPRDGNDASSSISRAGRPTE
jgi:hypothetical protein